jgi:chromosome segregation ATPase
METNGDFRKYFDDLNRLLGEKFNAIDKRFDGVDKRLHNIEKRLDVVESSLEVHGQLISAMQKTQQVLSDSMVLLIREVRELRTRVEKVESEIERLERGQTELIKMVTEIRGLESGKPLQLKEVRYDEVGHTLTGVVREKSVKYGRKKK